MALGALGGPRYRWNRGDHPPHPTGARGDFAGRRQRVFCRQRTARLLPEADGATRMPHRAGGCRLLQAQLPGGGVSGHHRSNRGQRWGQLWPNPPGIPPGPQFCREARSRSQRNGEDGGQWGQLLRRDEARPVSPAPPRAEARGPPVPGHPGPPHAALSQNTIKRAGFSP